MEAFAFSQLGMLGFPQVWGFQKLSPKELLGAYELKVPQN